MKCGDEAGMAAKYIAHVVSGCEVERFDSGGESGAMRGGLSCSLAASFGRGTAVLSQPSCLSVCKLGARPENVRGESEGEIRHSRKAT